MERHCYCSASGRGMLCNCCAWAARGRACSAAGTGSLCRAGWRVRQCSWRCGVCGTRPAPTGQLWRQSIKQTSSVRWAAFGKHLTRKPLAGLASVTGSTKPLNVAYLIIVAAMEKGAHLWWPRIATSLLPLRQAAPQRRRALPTHALCFGKFSTISFAQSLAQGGKAWPAQLPRLPWCRDRVRAHQQAAGESTLSDAHACLI